MRCHLDRARLNSSTRWHQQPKQDIVAICSLVNIQPLLTPLYWKPVRWEQNSHISHVLLTIGQVKNLSRFSSRIGGTMQPLWPARTTLTTRNSMRGRMMMRMRMRMRMRMGLAMEMKMQIGTWTGTGTWMRIVMGTWTRTGRDEYEYEDVDTDMDRDAVIRPSSGCAWICTFSVG